MFQLFIVQVLRLIRKLHESSSSNTRAAAQFLQRLIQLLPTLSDTAAGASSRVSSAVSSSSAEASDGVGAAASLRAYRNREQFSGLCLEMLLEFAFGQLSERLQCSESTVASCLASASSASSSSASSSEHEPKEKDSNGALMLDALLARCRSILTRFLQDQQLGGSAPLSRFTYNSQNRCYYTCSALIHVVIDTSMGRPTLGLPLQNELGTGNYYVTLCIWPPKFFNYPFAFAFPLPQLFTVVNYEIHPRVYAMQLITS